MGNHKVSIVMIDDDDVDVEAVGRLFKRQSALYALTVFHDGSEAVDALSSSFGDTLMANPSLILLDLNMPRMNGIEFLDWLRSQPALRRSIVFVLTTSDSPSDCRQAYDRQVAGYLVKSQLGQGYAELLPMLDCFTEYVRFPQ